MEERDSSIPSVPEAVEEAPAMSAPATLIGIFVKPRATFQALFGKPRVLVPLVVVLVLQLLFGVVIMRSGAAQNDAVAKMEAKGDSPEKIEMVEKAFEQPGMAAIILAGGPIAVTFILLLEAALFFFMANLMLGARLTFKHYFCIAAYSAVIGVVEQTVVTLLATSKGTMDVRLGVGAFFGDDPGYFVKVLNAATDPLVLWASLISALGISVFAKKGIGFGVLAVLPAFLLMIAMSGTR